MKLSAIKLKFQEELKEVYPKEEIDSFFWIVIEFYCGVSRLQLALQPNIKITAENVKKISKALEELKVEKPIQYILGETEFYGLPFKVNETVLIPRPETEELVEWIIKELTGGDFQSSANFQIANTTQLNILDIGTGSGCIAISLAKHLPKATVYALDVSEAALHTAKQNAKENNVAIEFIHGDILTLSSLKQNLIANSFDIIVSNPPYVRELEKAQMQNNVLKNEPHLALFVEDTNPLEFYDAITNFAVNNLNSSGQLFFEINEYLGEEMVNLLERNQFKNIELKIDLFGKNRMVKGNF